ncbi:MAG: FHA domain-containing protein [Planctomycetota bacterium]|nr:FHA domain-containing protein [Planctomycetota bacterium]
MPFAAFFASWVDRTREEFLAEVRAPHLVLPRLPLAGEAEPPDAATERVDPARTVAYWDLQVLVPLLPAADAAPISIGRGSDNDVVVADARVSKVQAYLERRDDEWRVLDAGSTNGTRADLQRVPTERGVAVRSGTRIRLAEAIDVVFFEPEGLLGVLERVRRARVSTEVPPPDSEARG